MQVETIQNNILVVDAVGSGLGSRLASLGIDNKWIYPEPEIELAMESFEHINPSVLLVSISPTQMEGARLINWVRQRYPIAIIAASYDASAETAASAIHAGASDFLDLGIPDASNRLGKSIRQSLNHLEEDRAINQMEHPLFDQSEVGFIGASQSMLEVSKLIISAAKSNASVFITGENGTGKEVCAELIHRFSSRSEHDLVTLNCAAIPTGLAESEVFGHIKGSFTGAVNDRIGVASLADKGTLFLDEIGEMEVDIQSKLLRFVQTGIFSNVGSSQKEQVDVRFICATNRDPNQQIADGDFRQDLFYRLNVIQIHLPPLRERGDDILAFARNFLSNFSVEENKRFSSFSPETEKLLMAYSWPGNVRELQNVIRSIVVLNDAETVIPSMLPLAVIREKGQRRRRKSDYGSNDRAVPIDNADDNKVSMVERLKENVRLLSDAADQKAHKAEPTPANIKPLDDVIEATIKEAISICQGNIAEASHHLGVSTSTLYRKMKN